MSIDVAKLTRDELRNLHENATRKGRQDIALQALQELTRRGGGRKSDYALLRWNQDSARAALEPFAEIARSVAANRRTAYTEAGGRKIGRRRDDPEWMWVDSYSAIKTAAVNGVIVCYVPRPGDDAYFQMILNGNPEARYEPDDLPAALTRWRAIAAEATS